MAVAPRGKKTFAEQSSVPQPARWLDRAGVSAAQVLGIFLLVASLSVLSLLLGRHSEGVAVIWLSNGLLFGIVVRQPPRTWLVYAVIGCVADLTGSLCVGEHSIMALVASLANSVEVFLTAWLLTRWFGSPLRLSRPRPLFAFLLVGVLLVPTLASMPSALWLSVAYAAPWWRTLRTLFLGDALGMAIIAPLTFTALDPAFFRMFDRRTLPSSLLVLLAPVCAASLDFGQELAPVSLLILPALVFVAFRLGFPGVVVGIFLAACVMVPLTLGGHGPMMFATGTTMLHKIVLVQLVIAIAVFTAFPVASLLEDRTELEQSVRDRETRLIELAHTDALTGQPNRRAFDERLEAEWQRAAATQLPLGLLYIDVDLFKPFNDLYGHLAGDDCLRHLASLAAQAISGEPCARLYRLGGEEFAVILPDPCVGKARELAEHIRQTIFAARLEHTGNPQGRQTVSVGVVTVIPSLSKSALTLIARSDAALYAAKHNGRNRCEAA